MIEEVLHWADVTKVNKVSSVIALLWLLICWNRREGESARMHTDVFAILSKCL